MRRLALVLVGVLLGASLSPARADTSSELHRLVAAVEKIAHAMERCK